MDETDLLESDTGWFARMSCVVASVKQHFFNCCSLKRIVYCSNIRIMLFYLLIILNINHVKYVFKRLVYTIKFVCIFVF